MHLENSAINNQSYAGNIRDEASNILKKEKTYLHS